MNEDLSFIAPVVCIVVMLAVFSVIHAITRRSPFWWLGRAVSRFHRPYYAGTATRRCGNPYCRSANPMQANFCRRCGQDLLASVSHRPLSMAPPPQYNPQTGNPRQMMNV